MPKSKNDPNNQYSRITRCAFVREWVLTDKSKVALAKVFNIELATLYKWHQKDWFIEIREEIEKEIIIEMDKWNKTRVTEHTEKYKEGMMEAVE